MPDYTVKTHDNRNLVIEADSYNFEPSSFSYEFVKKGKHIATVPAAGVFTIVLNDNVKSDYYWVYDWNKEDEKEAAEEDLCTDCQTAELLESDVFWGAVWEVVEAYHAPDSDFPTPTQNLDPYPIEKWEDKYGTTWHGFHTPKGFVHFSTYVDAKEGVKSQLEDENAYWHYLDLSTSTKQPLETIQ